MKKKLIFNHAQLSITLRRLCAELIERYSNFNDILLVGLQPRGVFLSQRLLAHMKELGHQPLIGALDVTFHRDDFHTKNSIRQGEPTRLEHSIEDRKVILIDDVLYTGRTVRAALDALVAYGRPKRMELLVLIDRVGCRDVPIKADYVGRRVSTLENQYIYLELTEQNKEEDGIWLAENRQKA